MRLQSKVAFNRRDLVQENYIMRTLNSIVTTPSNIKRAVFFNQQGASTALFDRSANAQNANLSAAASTLSPNKANIIRTLNFNGTTYFDFADADDLSFGDGSTDSAFSIVALINPNVVTSAGILCKIATNNREYDFRFGETSKLDLVLYDTSTSGYIYAQSASAISSGDIGSYHTYCSTYSGNSVCTGIKLYRDGTALTLGYGNNSYTAMENLTSKVNTSNESEQKGNAKYGFIAVIAEELSATQITNIHNLLINS